VSRPSLKGLTLRSRLLVAVGVVAFVQVAAAFLAISYVSDELLDQVDERLLAAADSAASGGGGLSEASGVYRGIVTPEGALVTSTTVSDRGKVLPPPAVTPELLTATGERPVTVEAQRGQFEWRAIVVDTESGTRVVYARPLDGYEWTRNRLIRLVTITTGAVLVTLGLVAWWIARLGIAPINRMTRAAEQIAAGEGLSVRIDVAPAGTEAGELARALSTMMTRIEETFRQRAQTEQLLRQFIADASHELRTPVATIRGYAELYRSGGLAEKEDLDDAMRRVLHESERMSRLIADLLNLAKLDQRPDLRLDAVDLGGIVGNVVLDVTVTLQNPSIRADTDAEPVIVMGDADLLLQAVGNLVANAIVHNPPGTEVVVSVRGEADRGTITVSDNGVGMAEAVVGRVTERFFRGDPSRGRDIGGSGLGLSIVASIVAAHGGELHIDSAENAGTSVSLSLPRFPEAHSSQRTPSELIRPAEIGAADSSHGEDE
jgi:two-component system OmpR family sensor kinase